MASPLHQVVIEAFHKLEEETKLYDRFRARSSEYKQLFDVSDYQLQYYPWARLPGFRDGHLADVRITGSDVIFRFLALRVNGIFFDGDDCFEIECISVGDNRNREVRRGREVLFRMLPDELHIQLVNAVRAQQFEVLPEEWSRGGA